MTEVWDLEVDYDMTSTSMAHSVGLYATKALAQEALKKLELKSWQWSSIDKRTVVVEDPITVEKKKTRLKYIAACIDTHADKFPTPKHMRGYADFLRELAA